jgi:hypothetical protein
MQADWGAWLARWVKAGLIDAATAERIRTFEAGRASTGRLRWPILIAIGFGALLICGGILLFVAANWDAMSPATRFSLVLLLVAAFHIGGAFSADRFTAMSTALHVIGTATLGAGIALAGQIFNLEEHWPAGILMWAIGAAMGWVLLRDTAQMALLAILAPAWLVSEWMVAAELHGDTMQLLATTGVFLLAVTYLTAAGPGRLAHNRRVLVWLGAVGFAVAAAVLTWVSADFWPNREWVPSPRYAIGWGVAVTLPLLLAFLLRGAAAWPNLVTAVWVLLLPIVRAGSGVAAFAWWAVGAIGLVAWGLRDSRSERINIGAMLFAAVVVSFYFSQVMDKLGRSASLVGLGMLFLGGGWALERARRRLVQQTRGAS